MSAPISLRYRPAFFATFAPNDNESFNSYVLRLASANYLPGIKGVVKVLNTSLGCNLTSSMEILTNKTALQELGAMAMGDEEALLSYAVKRVGDSRLYMRGCDIDSDAVMSQFAQICPYCLNESGFANEAWDYASVVTCSVHRTKLVDCCTQCNTRIDWARPHIFQCGSCGEDLRKIIASVASDTDIETSADFEALMSFCVLSQNGHSEQATWNEAFRLVKAIALDDTQWSSMKYPWRKFFNQLAHSQRFSAVRSFALARKNNCYMAGLLKPILVSKLRHLTQIPAQFVVERYITQFLRSKAMVSYSLASAVAYAIPPPEIIWARSLCSGNHPIIRNLEDISEFIGCNIATTDGLFENGILSRPREQYLGRNIDELLDAIRFLKEDLLGFSELCMIAGVSLNWEDLKRNEVIQRWNRRAPDDCRVKVSEAIYVQNSLHLAIHARPAPESPVSLGTLADHSARPCLVVLGGVLSLLTTKLRCASWKGPCYSWADINIDAAEANVILCDSNGRRFEP